MSLADQAKDALKKEIFSGALKPGERIDISEYAKRWAISPTPLRDALKNLEVSGIVEVSPRRGVFVAKLDERAFREILDLRICLEPAAVRLAAPNIPREVAEAARDAYLNAGNARPEDRVAALEEVDFLIHRLAKEYCGNSRLKRMLESAWDQFQWSRHAIIWKVEVPFDLTLPEHIRICECLIKGDGACAETAMRQHLEHSRKRLSSNTHGVDT